MLTIMPAMHRKISSANQATVTYTGHLGFLSTRLPILVARGYAPRAEMTRMMALLLR